MKKKTEFEFNRPYETWRQKTNILPSKTKWITAITLTILVLINAPVQWIIFSDIVVWNKTAISHFSISMFVLFLIGMPVGFYLSSKGSVHYLAKLHILFICFGCVGAFGMLLLPSYLYINYALDFSQPEIVSATVSEIKPVRKKGNQRSNLIFTTALNTQEFHTLPVNTSKYAHLKVGDRIYLVIGQGFLGTRYIYKVQT
jgi:hypothetical protein